MLYEVITDYMYTYLYNEAVHLDALQSTMITSIAVKPAAARSRASPRRRWSYNFV